MGTGRLWLADVIRERREDGAVGRVAGGQCARQRRCGDDHAGHGDRHGGALPGPIAARQAFSSRMFGRTLYGGSGGTIVFVWGAGMF